MTTHGAHDGVGPGPAEARFERLYAEHGRAVLAYAVRRAGDAHDAADVVAETFLVAWRRLDEVPPSAAARLWLYGVARHVLANQQRAQSRRLRLAERLRRELPTALAAAALPAPEPGRVSAALGRLGDDDREILRLSAWEELSPAQIATVLEIGQIAARSRLHRARRRLREAIEDGATPEDPSPARLLEAR
jgi:RNA polymerase sigma-70 factor (ECF subfamily)